MTGFGKVTAELPSKKVTVEIKALNSKQLDLSTRIPSDRKSTRLNSSHSQQSRMPSSA